METLHHDIHFWNMETPHYKWIEEHLLIIKKSDRKRGFTMRVFCTYPFGDSFWDQYSYIVIIAPYDAASETEEQFYTKLAEYTKSFPQDRREKGLLIGFMTLFEVLTFFDEHINNIKILALEIESTTS